MSGETKKRLLLSKWRSDQESGTEQRGPFPFGQDAYAEQLEQALVDVKYWLHDGLVHHKLVSDPRALLRKVEDAIL